MNTYLCELNTCLSELEKGMSGHRGRKDRPGRYD
jgi:hypothetical protein